MERRDTHNPNVCNEKYQNNKAWGCGTIEEELKLDHEINWEKFYRTKIRIYRTSGNYDVLNLTVPETLLDNGLSTLTQGMHVEVGGQLRSYNKILENGRSHLEVSLFVTSLNILSKEDYEEAEDANLIYLDGYVCKPPTYRITPFGREITDIMLKVNRAYGKTDYIPCIAWSRFAKYASVLNNGDRIELYGRFQSREYFKRVAPDSGIGETRVAYEVSILKMKKKN